MAVKPSSRTAPRLRSVSRKAPRRKRTANLWPVYGLAIAFGSSAALLWQVFPSRLTVPWAIANGIELALGRTGTAAILLAMAAGGLLFLGAEPRKVGRLSIGAGGLLLLAASTLHVALAGGSDEVETLRRAGGHLGFWLTRMTFPILGSVGHWALVAFCFAAGGMAVARMVAESRMQRPSTALPDRSHRPARGRTPTTETKLERSLSASGIRQGQGPNARSREPRSFADRTKRAGEAALTPTAEPPASENDLAARSIRTRRPKRAEIAAEQPSLSFALGAVGEDGYAPPPLDLLVAADSSHHPNAEREVAAKIATLENTLSEFGVEGTVVEVSRGPSVTRFEVRLAPGIKVNRIVSLADNLAMSLAATDVRIEAPIPGKAAIGVEAPTASPRTVRLRECLDHPSFWTAPGALTIPLGMDVAGDIRFCDLARMPHLLVAGSTNSGKSVCLNALIASLVMRNSPATLRMILIDPKRVELSLWDGIPHLLFPAVRSMKQAAGAFRSAIMEMDRRYELFAKLGTRNVEGYNQRVPQEERIPYIVIVVDELADLMMQAAAEAETAICRLAQLARATGIHLVVATQRPSVDVVTGLIKANIPSRIAFACSSQVDSRTILDMNGAERLVGRGDLLFLPIDQPKPVRIQGCYVDEAEIERIVRHLKGQAAPPFEIGPLPSSAETFAEGEAGEDVRDDLFEPSVRLVVTTGQASTSMIQRKFKVGYGRAARLLDAMESRGVVGPLDGSKPRKVLMNRDEMERMFAL